MGGKKLAAFSLAACLLLSACAGAGDGDSQADGTAASAPEEPSAEPASEESGIVTVASGLKVPWAIDFYEDRVYVSERGGSIATIDGSGAVTRKTVRLNEPLRHVGEGGLLGFVLLPGYGQTGQAVAYHTYESGGEAYNRIVLLKEADREWTETAVLLDGIPGSDNHNGGRLAIGPDGHLYATTGDTYKEELAQRKDTLAGKILRMTLSGEIPADNPFPDSYIYSYGHRNPQGLAWNAAGELYATEHGPSGDPGGHDEINRIEPGGNYGWPLVIGDAKSEGTVPPLYHTGEEAIAPSGAAFGSDGRLLIAALRGEKLFRYDVGSGVPTGALSGEGRLRDVKLHDGSVYVITNNTDGRGRPAAGDDRLLRIR